MKSRSNDPFDHPFFTDRDRNVTRTSLSSRRKTPSLAATAGLGVAAVLGTMIAAVVILAASGALLGWLGMLAAGILGTSVAFLTVAWPLGVIASVVLGIIRGKSN